MTESEGERTTGEMFAAELIDQVRDPALKEGLDLVAGKYPGAIGAAWAAADEAERLRMAVSNSVDEAIFRLLHAIDNAALELRWVRSPGGEPVELAGSSDFDLAGEYISEGGWRDTYTQEPHYPY